MAKRFTDTDKIKKRFWRALPLEMKVLWDYLCLDCDHAGVWEVDFETASARIGFNYDAKLAVAAFGDKIEVVGEGDKWFIPSFVEFQYNVSPEQLNPSNKVHASVLERLRKAGLKSLPRPVLSILENPLEAPSVAPLQAPCIGAKDKEKDKDKDSSSLEERNAKCKVTPAEISECVQAWGHTLGSFGVPKDPRFDEVAIARMAIKHGFEPTRMALLGAADERPTETFNPKDHVSVLRVEKHFQKFTNLGAKVLARLHNEGGDRVEA
ncbi:MAG: replication initiator [Mu-like cryoconite phage AB09]|nr:MAG: replication initiator [Mu-like cryoconite phage AB09]